MFLFSGRVYWQELIESTMWAHDKLKVGPTMSPDALSITQGRAVGAAHYILGANARSWRGKVLTDMDSPTQLRAVSAMQRKPYEPF